MSAYLIVMTKVLKTEGWEPYQSKVGDCFSRFGGTQVVLRATPEVLEGTFVRDRMTMFRFPSMEAIRTMWYSEEYLSIRALRDGLGELDVLAVPGV